MPMAMVIDGALYGFGATIGVFGGLIVVGIFCGVIYLITK